MPIEPQAPATLIAAPAEHAALERALSTCRELALDTESNSMFAYRERLCLVQLALADGPADEAPRLFVIDPLAFADVRSALGPLVPWLTAPEHRVLLHGGEYDVAVLRRELDLAPARVFDTQAAALLLGLERTGFGALVETFLDVSLPKSHQQFDWGRRPLPAAALAYALDDVRWLVPLARRLEAIVAEAELEDEVDIACRAVAAARPHAPRDPAEAFWRVVAGERPGAAELALLFALFQWREAVAAERDVPPARLLPNEALHRLVAARPTNPAELAALSGLPRDLMARRGPDLLAALERARAEPPTPPRRPALRPRPDSGVRQRENRLKAWREAEARRRGVSLQAVLPAKALEHLALHGAAGLADAPQLGDKRLGLYGEALRAVLAGA